MLQSKRKSHRPQRPIARQHTSQKTSFQQHQHTAPSSRRIHSEKPVYSCPPTGPSTTASMTDTTAPRRWSPRCRPPWSASLRRRCAALSTSPGLVQDFAIRLSPDFAKAQCRTSPKAQCRTSRGSILSAEQSPAFAWPGLVSVAWRVGSLNGLTVVIVVVVGGGVGCCGIWRDAYLISASLGVVGGYSA